MYDKNIDIVVSSDPIIPVRRSLPYQGIGRRKQLHFEIYSWEFHDFLDQIVVSVNFVSESE